MIKIRGRLPKKLKWGVMGLGKFSETAILPALMNTRKARTVSVYSRSSARAKTIADKFSIPNHYADMEEFLKSDIEAVYVGSANVDHFNYVIAAAKAKKHILCDKPLALNSAEAEEMVRVCKENNVLLAVNYVYRFHPLIDKAKELIEKQTIGKLISITANFNINCPPDNNFRFQKKMSGGGVMRDLGTHTIDMFRFLNGEMDPVACVLDNLLYPIEVEDYATGLLHFKSGGYASFSVSSNSARAFNRIEVLGTRGSVNIENLISSRFSSAKMTILLEHEAKKAFRKRANKLHISFRSITNSFLKGTRPIVTGEDGLINMRLMEQLENYAKKI